MGTRHAFFYHFSVHLSSVLGRTELCHEVWTPGPQKPQIISNENHHLALFGKCHDNLQQFTAIYETFSVPSPSSRPLLDFAGSRLWLSCFFFGPDERNFGTPTLSAPKSRDSLRLRRRFLPLPEKSRDFLRPQDARFPLRRKSLANRDFFCDENG